MRRTNVAVALQRRTSAAEETRRDTEHSATAVALRSVPSDLAAGRVDGLGRGDRRGSASRSPRRGSSCHGVEHSLAGPGPDWRLLGGCITHRTTRPPLHPHIGNVGGGGCLFRGSRGGVERQRVDHVEVGADQYGIDHCQTVPLRAGAGRRRGHHGGHVDARGGAADIVCDVAGARGRGQRRGGGAAVQPDYAAVGAAGASAEHHARPRDARVPAAGAAAARARSVRVGVRPAGHDGGREWTQDQGPQTGRAERRTESARIPRGTRVEVVRGVAG
eukprot:ctg_1465.g445